MVNVFIVEAVELIKIKYNLYNALREFIAKNWIIFGYLLMGIVIQQNNMHAGGTVPPNKMHAGGTYPPNPGNCYYEEPIKIQTAPPKYCQTH